MAAITSLGRLFIGIAMVAFGLQHLVYGDFVTRLVPKLPGWVPWHSFWAYLFGAGLAVAGVGIILGKKARVAATLLGGIVLLSALLLHLPQVVANPHLGGVWTDAGKALALSGAAFLIAGSLTRESGSSASWYSPIITALARLIPLGRFFLGAFLILTGIQHFLYAKFVAQLVPSWIPGHLFWTYFAGIALIAGGAGIIIPFTTRLAAALSGIMIFLWVVLLHIPRAVAAPRDSNETTAVFEALAISGAAFLVAAAARKKKI